MVIPQQWLYAVTGTPANTAPVGSAQNVIMTEDTVKAITLAATDANGDALTYAVVALPAHGSLSGVALNVNYTPTANYNGSDSFTFKANDGTVDSVVATVTITVTAINDPPLATPQSISLNINTAKAITLVATDVEGSAMSYAIVASPTHGALSGTAPNLTYTPALNYSGADSFTFKANDGTIDSAAATVSITVISSGFIWNSAVSGNWSDGTKWTAGSGSPASAGAVSYVLNFNPSGTYTATNDLSSGFLLNQVNFGGSSATLAGNAVSFAANGTTLPQLNQNAGSAVTISAPLGLAANLTAGGSGTGSVNLTGVISGSGVLTKTTSGALYLSGVNTYSGGTVISGGTLSMASQANNVLGTGPVTISSGATLNLARNQITRALTMNGGLVTMGGGWSDCTWAGTITLGADSGINTSDAVSLITANMSGAGGLKKGGTGGLRLNGVTNNYAGVTTVNSGILHIKSSLYGNDTAQWNPAHLTVASGAALVLNVGGAGDFTMTQAGTLFSSLTAVSNNGLKAGSAIGFDTTNAGATIVTVSGKLANSTGTGGGMVGLRKYGGGTLELTGANTYGGQTVTENGGTLKVSSFNSVNGGTPLLASSSLGAPTTVANGTIVIGQSSFVGGTLIYTGTGETTDRVINIAGQTATVTLDQSGTGLLKFTSPLVIATNGYQKIIVLQGSSAGSGEIASVIPNGSAVVSKETYVTKSGSGTWTLSGTNLYTGATTITGGVLACASGPSLGSGALKISAGAKAALNFTGTRQVASLTLAGSAQANGTYGSTASTATNKSDTYFSGTGTVTVGPLALVAPSGYSAWTAGSSQGLTAGSNDGPLDDPDHDGICNLLEFALSGAPTASSPQILPKLAQAAGNWVFEYDRSGLSLEASTQVVEFGSDLTGWTPVDIPATSGRLVTITPGSPTTHVTVTIPATGVQIFFRLKVSQ